MRHLRRGQESAASVPTPASHRRPERVPRVVRPAHPSRATVGITGPGLGMGWPRQNLRELHEIAGEIVAQSDREHPADQVLRQTLKSRHTMAQRDKTVVAHAVFAYYRWQGWLDPDSAL